MVTLASILATLEDIAPTRYAFEFDNVGLQVGRRDAQIAKAVVALDRSLAAVQFAAESGAHLLLTHHPLLMSPLRAISDDDYEGRTVLKLIEAGIACVTAHTNWDCAAGGINDTLAALFALSDVQDFGASSEAESVKLTVYAPEAAVKAIEDAIFAAGAGVIGAYDRCAFRSEGIGTFRPGSAANPLIGTVGQIEAVRETRIEAIMPRSAIGGVTAAVRSAHPYEEPAYDFSPVIGGLAGRPAGRVGKLPHPVTLSEFTAEVDARLGTKSLTWGDPDRRVCRIGFVGGAASGDWRAALRAGADVFVTGEVKQHDALEASENGLAVIAAGHYATEQPGVETLATLMAQRHPDVDWSVFAPTLGAAGRPW